MINYVNFKLWVCWLRRDESLFCRYYIINLLGDRSHITQAKKRLQIAYCYFSNVIILYLGNQNPEKDVSRGRGRDLE